MSESAFRTLRHDLRTPLNHILGYAELLLEEAEAAGHSDFVADLQKICLAGRELLAVVNRRLDSARLRAGDPEQLSHELRTPLNAIIGYSDLLREEAEERGLDALVPDLEKIHQAGLRLLGLVNAVLDLSRFEAGGSQPAEPDQPAAEAGPPADSRPGPAGPVAAGRLLVVDDDAQNRELLARRLERLGYRVAQAEHGRAALEKLAAEPFDLLLLDVVMPELDGFQVLQRLQADGCLRDLPVIVLSASDETESAVRCIQLGAEDYLPKPFDVVLLRARIGASLEKKRLRDQEQRHAATIEAQAAELAELNRTLEARVQQQVDELERVGRLRRYLAPQLAEAIVSSGDESLLESHRRQITVVFCDLRGFTAFAESAEPEEVMGVLGAYHAALGELIFRFEGTLERFAGDGLMVFFNDPLPIPDHAERAVRMAVAMRERVGELAAGWRKLGYELGFGVGIAQGYATLGKIGFEGRYDYAAIGTVTNLAARLCGDAAEGQILIAQRLHAALEALVEAEPIDPLTLKGFLRPVPAYAVVALKAAEADREAGPGAAAHQETDTVRHASRLP